MIEFQAYEWSVEASQLASRLKLEEEPRSTGMAKHLLRQVEHFLTVNDVNDVNSVNSVKSSCSSGGGDNDVDGVSAYGNTQPPQVDVQALITQLKSLASKLHDNPKLTQQCHVTQLN